jgi:hypothetical protein
LDVNANLGLQSVNKSNYKWEAPEYNATKVTDTKNCEIVKKSYQCLQQVSDNATQLKQRSFISESKYHEQYLPQVPNNAMQLKQGSRSNSKTSPILALKSKNPYVWVSDKSKDDCAKQHQTLIKLDSAESIAIIKNEMKSNKNPESGQFNKELMKNKPLPDIRKSLVNNKYLSDVKFIVNGQIVHAHKMFLVTASSLFHDCFIALGAKDMIVNTTDYGSFLNLITYCYTGLLDVNEDNVLPLLEISIKYNVRQATNICHGFISNKINSESVFKIFQHAIDRESELFQKRCLDYIIKEEEKCLSSNAFYDISLEMLKRILFACNYTSEKSGDIMQKWHNGRPFMNQVEQQQQEQKVNIDQSINSQSLVKNTSAKNTGATKKNFSKKAHRQPVKCEIKCPDDELEGKMHISINGELSGINTNAARIDFVCKSSILLQNIWFIDDLFKDSSKEMKILIGVRENGTEAILHDRIIKNDKQGEFILENIKQKLIPIFSPS